MKAIAIIFILIGVVLSLFALLARFGLMAAPAVVATYLERCAKMKMAPARIWRISAVIFGMSALVSGSVFLAVFHAGRSHLASLSPEAREEMMNDKGDPLGLQLGISFIVFLFLIMACLLCLYSGNISSKNKK